MKHANLSIFVPHAGCPHRCSFCDQNGISGAAEAPDGASVAALCAETAARTQNFDAEIAFFGGSFTAIDRSYLLELLEAAAPFVENGAFSGIRISTRPDCIDPEILALLARYHVRAIELGAQSMSDAVLLQNGRGHTAEDVAHASELIRSGGFELGLQMMTGLYGSDARTDYETACRLAELCPATVRVYPALVLEDTRLAVLWRAGEYCPQTLEEAAALGARLLAFFEERGIRVIRMGLHAQESLERGLLAGPYHPAFRELCECVLMKRALAALLTGREQGAYTVRVAPKMVSKITGHGGKALDAMRKIGYNITIRQDGSLSGRTLEIGEV